MRIEKMLQPITTSQADAFARTKAFYPNTDWSFEDSLKQTIGLELNARLTGLAQKLGIYRNCNSSLFTTRKQILGKMTDTDPDTLDALLGPDLPGNLPISLGIQSFTTDPNNPEWTLLINYSYEKAGDLFFPRLMDPSVILSGNEAKIPSALIRPDYLGINSRAVHEGLAQMPSLIGVNMISPIFCITAPDNTRLDAAHIFPSLTNGKYNLANPIEAFNALREVLKRHFQEKYGHLLAPATDPLTLLMDVADHNGWQQSFSTGEFDELPLAYQINAFDTGTLIGSAFADVMGEEGPYIPMDQVTIQVYPRVRKNLDPQEHELYNKLKAHCSARISSPVLLSHDDYRQIPTLFNKWDIGVTRPMDGTDLEARASPEFLVRFEWINGKVAVTGVLDEVLSSEELPKVLRASTPKKYNNRDTSMWQPFFADEWAELLNPRSKDIRAGMPWKRALALIKSELVLSGKRVSGWRAGDHAEEIQFIYQPGSGFDPNPYHSQNPYHNHSPDDTQADICSQIERAILNDLAPIEFDITDEELPPDWYGSQVL